LAPGHDVQVTVTGRNDSRIEVQRLHVKILEKLAWKANGQCHAAERTISEDCWDDLLEDGVWSPLRRRVSHEYQSMPHNEQQYTDQEVLNNDDEESAAPAQVRLSLPQQTRHCYHGSLLEVSHELVVSAVTSGCCFVTSPKISCPLQIRNITSSSPPQAYAQSSGGAAIASATMVSNKDYHHYPTESSSTTIPVALAEVLPDNWSRHTAPVVQLAVAQAILVEESDALAGSYAPTAPRQTFEALAGSYAPATAPPQTFDKPMD
jgi:hypothetical protein